MKHKLLVAAAFSLGMASASVFAQSQVDVSDAWARGTVPGQTSSAVYMTLQAHQATTLLSVSTPAAANAEVHEMKLEGTVMKMRALPKGLPLEANKPVELKPGSYHIMLTDLKGPLKKGDTVPVTLKFETADHKTSEQLVKATVRDLTAAAPAGGGMAGMAHGAHSQ
ncbi:copper chaperone PCu(A)C [Pandoraea sputorum]|uniref:copper chaperone PCu(A)C n=1 Tax=Pandoraea sputorum TaxID=93222 RepID=UPI001E5B6A8F|nr:copper chaperone PCu(A)C [Pandoraea sputorum]MCE4061127.1 copper chaperone PCu(A)C [Pandoraea sputorum]